MAWKIDSELVFPQYMDSSSYDAGVTVWDWFEWSQAPAGLDLDSQYETRQQAEVAFQALKKIYRGRDRHGVACRLEIVEA